MSTPMYYPHLQPISGRGLGSGVQDIFAGMLKDRAEKQALAKGEYENQYLKAKGERAPEVIQSEIDKNKAGSLYQAMVASLLGPEKASEAKLREAKIKYYYEGGGSRGTNLSNVSKIYAELQQSVDEDRAKGLEGNSEKTEGLMSAYDKASNQGATGVTRTRDQAMAQAEPAGEYVNNLVQNNFKYIGQGSNKRITDDLLKLSSTKDPEEEERIGNDLSWAAAFEKAIPEMAILDLKRAGNAQPSSPDKEEQRKMIRQGWPALGKFTSNNLPEKWQKVANRRYNEILKGIRGKERAVAKGRFRDEDQEQNVVEQQAFNQEIEGGPGFQIMWKKGPNGWFQKEIPTQRIQEAVMAGYGYYKGGE